MTKSTYAYSSCQNITGIGINVHWSIPDSSVKPDLGILRYFIFQKFLKYDFALFLAIFTKKSTSHSIFARIPQDLSEVTLLNSKSTNHFMHFVHLNVGFYDCVRLRLYVVLYFCLKEQVQFWCKHQYKAARRKQKCRKIYLCINTTGWLYSIGMCDIVHFY